MHWFLLWLCFFFCFFFSTWQQLQDVSAQNKKMSSCFRGNEASQPFSAESHEAQRGEMEMFSGRKLRIGGESADVCGLGCACPGRTFSFLAPNNLGKPTTCLSSAICYNHHRRRRASVAQPAPSVLRISGPLVSKCSFCRPACMRYLTGDADVVQADKKASIYCPAG